MTKLEEAQKEIIAALEDKTDALLLRGLTSANGKYVKAVTRCADAYERLAEVESEQNEPLSTT
jgi:hypothetical protein